MHWTSDPIVCALVVAHHGYGSNSTDSGGANPPDTDTDTDTKGDAVQQTNPWMCLKRQITVPSRAFCSGPDSWTHPIYMIRRTIVERSLTSLAFAGRRWHVRSPGLHRGETIAATSSSFFSEFVYFSDKEEAKLWPSFFRPFMLWFLRHNVSICNV